MAEIFIPTHKALIRPLLTALSNLGGSASISEMYDEVVEQEGFSEEQLAIMQNPDNSNQTKIGYRLAWARTYLKKAGYLDNSARGVWALTEKAKEEFESISSNAVVQTVAQQYQQTSVNLVESIDDESSIDSESRSVEIEEVSGWRETLHRVLIDEMSPDAFERLTQRLLRESGFIQVEVTGRTGDGGIDGRGIARINGLMSFHISFQCKKYKGSVGAPEIRDFRGATIGRSDRGLFITTGTFTKSAVEEASRDGVAPIDLIDGDQLANKLKELALGVRTELVEKVTIDSEWFLKL